MICFVLSVLTSISSTISDPFHQSLHLYFLRLFLSHSAFLYVCVCVCNRMQLCELMTEGYQRKHKDSLCAAAKQLMARLAEPNDDTRPIITPPIDWSNVSSVFPQCVYLFLFLGGGPLCKGCEVNMDI